MKYIRPKKNELTQIKVGADSVLIFKHSPNLNENVTRVHGEHLRYFDADLKMYAYMSFVDFAEKNVRFTTLPESMVC